MFASSSTTGQGTLSDGGEIAVEVGVCEKGEELRDIG